MKAIALRDSLGINQLQPIRQTDSAPRNNEVLVNEALIKLQAASLNSVDLLVVKGLLNPHLPLLIFLCATERGLSNRSELNPGNSIVTTLYS